MIRRELREVKKHRQKAGQKSFLVSQFNHVSVGRTRGQEESPIYTYSTCLIKRAKETKFQPCCEPQFTFLFGCAVDLRDATVALGKCQDMKKRSWLQSWPWFPAGCLATIKMSRRSRSQKCMLHLFLPDCSEPPSSSDFRCLINTTTSSAESNSPMK